MPEADVKSVTIKVRLVRIVLKKSPFGRVQDADSTGFRLPFIPSV